jgi:hypothetical protein
MGYYTEFKFKMKLKKDTPEEVINLLRRVIVDHDLGHNETLFTSDDVFKPSIDHEFFKCENWYMLFLSTNWTPNLQGGKFYQEGGYWKIDLHTEFKNYNNEIKHFFNWIKNYSVGRKKKQYVGWHKGEDMNNPIHMWIIRDH